MTDTQPFMDEALELRQRVLWESNGSIKHIATALSSAYQRGREDAAKIAECCGADRGAASNNSVEARAHVGFARTIAAAIRTERDKG